MKRRDILKWSAPVLSTSILPVHAQTSSISGFSLRGQGSCAADGLNVNYSITPTPAPQKDIQVNLSYKVSEGEDVILNESGINVITNESGRADLNFLITDSTATKLSPLVRLFDIEVTARVVDPVSGQVITKTNTMELASGWLAGTCELIYSD